MENEMTGYILTLLENYAKTTKRSNCCAMNCSIVILFRLRK